MDVVQPALLLKDGYKAITRVSETLVRVLFRSCAYYDVVAPDLIHSYVPKAVLSNQLIVATIRPATVGVGSGSTRARAPAASAARRSSRRSTSARRRRFGAVPTLTLRLTRDQWLPTLGTPAGAFITRDSSRASPRSSRRTAGERDRAARAARRVHRRRCTSVERIDQETAEIRLPALRFYEITKPETLELRVPAAAVLSDQQIVAPNTVRIRAEPGWATVWGSLVNSSSRRGLPTPAPIREGEIVAAKTLFERNLSVSVR